MSTFLHSIRDECDFFLRTSFAVPIRWLLKNFPKFAILSVPYQFLNELLTEPEIITKLSDFYKGESLKDLSLLKEGYSPVNRTIIDAARTNINAISVIFTSLEANDSNFTSRSNALQSITRLIGLKFNIVINDEDK